MGSGGRISCVGNWCQGGGNSASSTRRNFLVTHSCSEVSVSRECGRHVAQVSRGQRATCQVSRACGGHSSLASSGLPGAVWPTRFRTSSRPQVSRACGGHSSLASSGLPGAVWSTRLRTNSRPQVSRACGGHSSPSSSGLPRVWWTR